MYDIVNFVCKKNGGKSPGSSFFLVLELFLLLLCLHLPGKMITTKLYNNDIN